jgi:CBS domain containing-hemolysin-like protein
MLLFLSPLLYFFYLLFYPFVSIFNKINITTNKHIVVNKKELLKEKQEEFQHVFEHINDSINIEKDQKEIISNIFDYRDQTVEKVMTKRGNISAISSDSSLDELAHKFIDSGHSKLPIFNKNLDNIEGIIYLYDLYSKPKDLVEILRSVLYVPYSKLIPDLMQMFKDTKHSIAIVLDDQGKTAGIITIEDVFEELFGDFEDEFDYEKIQSIKKSDGSIITNAKISIVDFNLKYKNLIPSGTYETIGGYIINKIGRIPKKNEHLFLDIGHVIIRKATSRRIEQIQIFKN